MPRNEHMNVATRMLLAEQRAQRQTIIQGLIEQRFGPLDTKLVERLERTSMDKLNRLALRVNRVQSVDEVFASEPG